MKTKPLPGSLAILRWLNETRQNKAISGQEFGFYDIAEMLLPFVLPMKTIKGLTDEQITESVEELLETLTAEDFDELQRHAQNEIQKFTETAVTPKKPIQLPDNPTLWERIRLAWSVFFPG